MSKPAKGLLVSFADQLSDLAGEMRESASTDPSLGEPVAAGDLHASLEDVAQMLLDQLHMRKQFLSRALFHEPAWEILLSVFVAHRRGETLNVKQLVSLIDAPPTTSQRWIDQLVHMKLLQREVDHLDRRRLEISMAQPGVTAVTKYLEWWTTRQSAST